MGLVWKLLAPGYGLLQKHINSDCRVGVRPTGKWVIVSYMSKGQWLILCCCTILESGEAELISCKFS